ncbi:KDEL motif-containing protein 1 [Tetrabaena socialis]|uniref:KDEL motif-containing protein 1 n=1 Tax=Tetrabaena socialis TaxID=47790 RepID=A0A2J7ZYU9_9CHLO|nr:KDEL motif-containing protein 1 [Tetrabaena socialis]|eukprot:PNH05443.1 KDEL motif-containing protein 1 [Tetrabaena socialis]
MIGKRQLAPQQQEAAAYCSAGNFTALYQAIEADLRPWRDSGIPPQLMDSMLERFRDYPMRSKGVGVAFKGGVPFIITDPAGFEKVGHHKRLIAAHLALFSALSATFGAAIPDVEFLVGTADEPTVRLHTHANGTDPASLPFVMRFCKSDSHADLMVPDIHFFMRNFTGRTAAADLWFCDVRKHFIWQYARGANRSGLPIDVAQQPKRDMLYHASNKLLLHLDGQTCSSRLEQLLVLGSCVVKEESGYRAFFHHLLQPYQHYVPFWKEFPEEAADVMRWAAAHDGEAAAIAARAQTLAATYLHKRALMCYWLKMLQAKGGFGRRNGRSIGARAWGLAALLRYRPGPDAGDRRYPVWLPVASYMAGEGTQELERYDLTTMEFWD